MSDGRFPLLSGEITVPTLQKLAHAILVVWLTVWLLLWGAAEPCWSRGGRIGNTATCHVNSKRRQQIVMLIIPSHSPFTVRQYTTVKEVRLHSERGKAAVPRVVGTVATTPCCVIGITAPVTSWVRAPCVGSLALTGRHGVGARALEGSGETELTPEAKGVGRGGLCVRAPEGVGRDGTRTRGQGVGRATIWARDREDRCAGARVLAFCGWLSSSFAFFIALIWVSLFMVPNI